jgi:hypothetical protein
VAASEAADTGVQKPQQAKASGGVEGRLPAKANSYPGNKQWSNQRSRAGSRIEYSSGQRSFLNREPVGSRFECRRKVARLSYTQRKTGDPETERGARKGMADRRQRPQPDGQGISLFYPDAVDHPAGHQEPNSIGEDEAVDDITVTPVVESKVLIAAEQVLEDGFHQA